MAAAYYDFFRKILLQPDGITLEADSIEDTLTITGGNGVAFNPNASTDSFTIDVNYQLYVPLGTTSIRLNDVNSNTSDITISAGSNIVVARNSNNELVITATVGGTSKALAGITQASPGVLTTTLAHGFTDGIAVTITDVGGMTQVNGNEYYMDILTSNTFALYTDSNLSVPLDTTGFGAYTSGGIATAEYAAPQALNQLNDVSLVDLPVSGDFLQYNGTYWGKGTDINGTLTGDVKGSVFADDSTLMVDGVSGIIPWAVLNGTPTTLTGYGITDAASTAQGALADSALQTVSFAQVTSPPTTLTGYGITDAATTAQGALADSALQNGGSFDGDVVGSVFGDDSTILVDGINNKVVGNIDTASLRTSETTIALGYLAGETTQGNSAVAIGDLAGNISQAAYAVAIGDNAGKTTQGAGTVAIGYQAGKTTQGEKAVAIGNRAGWTGQGAHAIAIGDAAGEANQAANSIVINATGSPVQNTTASSLVIKPIRGADNTNYLKYNTTTGEVTYVADVAGVFTGDLTGSVFGDDSTVIVDGVNNSVIVNGVEMTGPGDYNNMIRIDGAIEVTGGGSTLADGYYSRFKLGLSVDGDLYANRKLVTKSTTTRVTTLNSPTGTVDLSINSSITAASDTWYLYQPAVGCVTNLIDFEIADNYQEVITINIFQGSIAVVPGLTITGAATNIQWQYGVVPTGSPNDWNVIQYQIMKLGGTLFITGQMGVYS